MTELLNILILGGSGFLSGTLARMAVSAGHRVWAVTRGQRAVPAGVTSLTADRREGEQFNTAIRDAQVHWDLVVDCIAFDPADIQQDLAILPGLARHLVMISTDFVYDPSRRWYPQTEEGIFIHEGYGGKKRQAEMALMSADPCPLNRTILRPCHIYGLGSQLGCLPAHGRDPRLIERLVSGEALRLVGGGHFLQQPIFARDLSKTILSVAGNSTADGQIFSVAGPDRIESREYYRMIAENLGVSLKIDEIRVADYISEHPESAPFLCHRIYDLSRLKAAGLAVPATPLAEGLREQVASLRSAIA